MFQDTRPSVTTARFRLKNFLAHRMHVSHNFQSSALYWLLYRSVEVTANERCSILYHALPYTQYWPSNMNPGCWRGLGILLKGVFHTTALGYCDIALLRRVTIRAALEYSEAPRSTRPTLYCTLPTIYFQNNFRTVVSWGRSDTRSHGLQQIRYAWYGDHIQNCNGWRASSVTIVVGARQSDLQWLASKLRH